MTSRLWIRERHIATLGRARVGAITGGLAVAALLAMAALLFAGGPAGAATGSATKLVPGYLNGLPLATRTGAAPAQRLLTVGVELQRPDSAGEIALYEQMYQRGSAEYHHFLTPAQFNQRFGVAPAQTSAVRQWLAGGGLALGAGSGDYVTARGTVAQLDRLFGVSIGSYVYKGMSFIANDAPPSVPQSLPVAGVAGLDTINRFSVNHGHVRALHRLAAAAQAAAPRDALAAARAVGPQAGSQNEFTPQELWGIYNDPGAAALTRADGTSTPAAVQSSSASLGQGQTIGIFGEGETSSVIDQLRLFEAAMGLPKVPVRVHHTEGGADSDYGDNAGAVEWYLDSQAATGMAPDVSRLDLYFAKTLFDADIFSDFNTWANDPAGPHQMNASFGECEANPTNPVTGPLAQQPYGTELGDELQAMGDPILRQAAMEGRTLFASSGDTGSGCPELVAPIIGAGNGVAVQPVPFVGYPCDSQYVVCVGGTVVTANGTTYPTAAQRNSETNWTFSGGGSSHFIPEPSYQQGISNITLPCVSTPDGTPYTPGSGPTCRGVPDIGDLSGNITGDGYFIYSDGEPSSEGGTSLSSPLMLGQWARVQAAASSATQHNGGLGFANPVIYAQAKDADSCSSAPCPSAPTYGRDFFDVTQSELGAGNGAYQPGPGWDYASGWGAINVANFTQDVTGTTTAATAAGQAEKTAVPVTTATMTSPAGNATDPADASLGNQPSLDLTRATLTTSANGATVTATLTGPSLGGALPADGAGGNIFRVLWRFAGRVYYLSATQTGTATFSYTSGDTGTYGSSSTYGYNTASNSAATGSYDATSHTVTIHAPAKEVGSPQTGDALTVPQAFDQLNNGALTLTTDSSDDLAPVSSDAGLADSIGQEVIVGGTPASGGSGGGGGGGRSGGGGGSGSGSSASDGLPGPAATGTTRAGGSFGGPSCRIGGPAVHVRATASGKGVRAHGVASNHGCAGRLTRVRVAFARALGHGRCRFLGAHNRFGRVTSCRPRQWRTVHGLAHWTETLRVKLPKGVYFLWAQATNTQGRSTRSLGRKHIYLRLRR